jgi:hypothetical protein
LDKSKPTKNPSAYRIPVRAYLDLRGGPGQIVLKDVQKT